MQYRVVNYMGRENHSLVGEVGKLLEVFQSDKETFYMLDMPEGVAHVNPFPFKRSELQLLENPDWEV